MAIPTVDLSPFFTDGDEVGRKKAKDIIERACSDYGFFQIANHGVPLHLITQSVELSRTFFALPDQEKLKYSPGSAAPLPAGYAKQKPLSPDKNEYMLIFDPQTGFNVFPTDPPDFRDVVEELFVYFRKTGELIEEIVNDCLGLPPGFLKKYNPDRKWDFMTALRYFPAAEGENNNGLVEHEDGNVLTFVIQDEVGGLEVKKEGNWIPVVPSEGLITVNLGDIIQVLSNKKFKSATHRVVRYEEKWRHSLVFFYSIDGDKWVEPLPEFTAEIGAASKYRGFFFKEYQGLRMRNKTHPPSRPEDVINISHYAISP